MGYLGSLQQDLVNSVFLGSFAGNPGAVPDILQAYNGLNTQNYINSIASNGLSAIQNTTKQGVNAETGLANQTNNQISGNLTATEANQTNMTSTGLSDISQLANQITGQVAGGMNTSFKNIQKTGKTAFSSVNSMFGKGTSEFQSTLQALSSMQQTASQFTQPISQESSNVATSPDCQAILNTSLSSINASISTNTIPIGTVTKTLTVPYYTVNGGVPSSQTIGG
ncbi:MAG TPA: hypothetical protein ENO40_04485 [Desulfurella acetivorans]|nr:hypothetical protein [Desulfurella acetivorans]